MFTEKKSPLLNRCVYSSQCFRSHLRLIFLDWVLPLDGTTETTIQGLTYKYQVLLLCWS